MQIGYDNCKDCISGCEHAGKDREFVYSAGKGSCKVKQANADLIAVVRCGECKHYRPKASYTHCAYPGGMLCPPDANGFCSYGQRRDQSADVRNMAEAEP